MPGQRIGLPFVPAAQVARIATRIAILPFQGASSLQRLYIIVSADADSGRILQVSTNYSPWPVGQSLRYQSNPTVEVDSDATPLVERLRAREAQFLARSQFDEIRYGSAALKRNDGGDMVRPVIALHGHFQRLKRRFTGVTDHYLAHECVLRGAAITAWAPDVRADKTRLWFVVEEGQSTSDAVFRHRGTWRLGWWNNRWQRWENDTACKMLSLLTGEQQTCEPQRVTLRACDAFIDWLATHPWTPDAHRLSARVISEHLRCLAWLYHQRGC